MDSLGTVGVIDDLARGIQDANEASTGAITPGGAVVSVVSIEQLVV